MSLRPFASIKTNLCVLFTTKGFDFNFDIHIDFDFDFDFNFDSNSATNQIDSLRFQKKNMCSPFIAFSYTERFPTKARRLLLRAECAIQRRFLRVFAVLRSTPPPTSTTHRQFGPQQIPFWKQSQYFFTHRVFWHLQPRRFVRVAGVSHTTCGSNTCGFRWIRACFTSSRSFRCSCASRSAPAPTGLFLQLTQLQPLQNTSDAKHSQYSFKHRDFRQLHVCFYPQKGETGKPNEWGREKTRQSWTLQDRAAAHAQATPLCVTNPDHYYRVAWFSTRSSIRPPRKNALLATWIARSTASLRFRRSPQRSSPSFSPSLPPAGVDAIANARRRFRSAESGARPRSRSLETTRLRPNCLPTPLSIIPRLEGSRSRRRSRFWY